MKKLGIAIKSTIMGIGEPYKVNPGPWDSKIVDIRDVLRHVPSLASDPTRCIVFLSFSETGTYITVARCYRNRPGDNIAGWIFVPFDIAVSGEELARTVENVRRIIFSAELPDRATMEKLFSAVYPIKPALRFRPSPKNGRFGVRNLSGGTPLNTVLAFPYQKYYSEFQAIFLENYAGEVENATDLTTMPLQPAPVPAPVEPVAVRTPRRTEPVETKNTAPEVKHPASESRSKAQGKTNVWLQRGIGFMAAILLGGITVGILALCGVFDSKKGESPAPSAQADVTTQPSVETSEPQPREEAVSVFPEMTTLEEAVTYLDGNTVWTKSEMEKYDHLKGLYDALNTFNFDALFSSEMETNWKNKLKGSEKFQKLIGHAEWCRKQKWDPSRQPDGSYNAPGDEAITVQAYMEWIDDGCSPKKREARKASLQSDTKKNTPKTSVKQEKKGTKATTGATGSGSETQGAEPADKSRGKVKR